MVTDSNAPLIKQPTPPFGPRSGKAADAVDLLKADHAQVATWFDEYEGAEFEDDKSELAGKICAALTVHATIEEEIFYPAFLEATGDEGLHHEAEVEHDSAKYLIAQIENSDPTDPYFDARVKVLSEMIKHHVKEEEQPDGMFAEARDSDMDLAQLGVLLQARKDELIANGDTDQETDDADEDEDEDEPEVDESDDVDVAEDAGDEDEESDDVKR